MFAFMNLAHDVQEGVAESHLGRHAQPGTGHLLGQLGQGRLPLLGNDFLQIDLPIGGLIGGARGRQGIGHLEQGDPSLVAGGQVDGSTPGFLSPRSAFMHQQNILKSLHR